MVKILVTRQIPDHFIEQLEQFGDVKMWKKHLNLCLESNFKRIRRC